MYKHDKRGPGFIFWDGGLDHGSAAHSCEKRGTTVGYRRF